jgi:hypothetical protein
VDAVTRRALTGHVTEQMQHHYSNVDVAEKRALRQKRGQDAPRERNLSLAR